MIELFHILLIACWVGIDLVLAGLVLITYIENNSRQKTMSEVRDIVKKEAQEFNIK